jgi:hypothetical protein
MDGKPVINPGGLEVDPNGKPKSEV